MEIKKEYLIKNLKDLGNIGRDENNKLSRVAATEADKKGRDFIVDLMEKIGLKVKIDKIGNIFGILENEENKNKEAIIVGSHIDTVINAGIYDGCYGVISSLEVVRTIKENNLELERPIVVGAFTNEEGIRFQPDMMGSLVYAGGLELNKALNTIGTDGTVLGEELKKIGYAGTENPQFIKPYAYLELHVEQGPILDYEKINIGVVENLQGISWQKITINGEANHAGTTPMSLRKDAGLVAAKIITYLNNICNDVKNSVVTIGSISFEPNAINVIPSKAEFTVDLRNPDRNLFKNLEDNLDEYLEKVSQEFKITYEKERLVRFEPVIFDKNIVEIIEKAANQRKLTNKKMTSGAGHDAQMMARICPTAMIFVPSLNGISHNPKEFTDEKDLENGANILLDVVLELTRR